MKLKNIFCLLLLVGLFISLQLSAEARAPKLVIMGFIEALQKNDLEYLNKYVDLAQIQQQPKHGYSLKQLQDFFADVDSLKIQCSKPMYDKKNKIIKVKLNNPLSFDFEMQHQNATIGKGDFYRIIAIHP